MVMILIVVHEELKLFGEIWGLVVFQDKLQIMMIAGPAQCRPVHTTQCRVQSAQCNPVHSFSCTFFSSTSPSSSRWPPSWSSLSWWRWRRRLWRCTSLRRWSRQFMESWWVAVGHEATCAVLLFFPALLLASLWYLHFVCICVSCISIFFLRCFWHMYEVRPKQHHKKAFTNFQTEHGASLHYNPKSFCWQRSVLSKIKVGRS